MTSSSDNTTVLVDVWGPINESSIAGSSNGTGEHADKNSAFGGNSVIYQVQLYMVPFLVVFGGVGNSLSLWIFCTPAFRDYSSSCYLAALAASDSLFLFTLFVMWASNLVFDVYNSNGWCQGVTYLTHVATFVSVWLVVAFTVERFIAVCYPLLRSAVCTVRRARAVVSGLLFLALVLYSYVLFAAGIEPSGPDEVPLCTLRKGYMGLASIMNTVDTILTLVLPVIAVLTLNARIAKCVYYIDSFQREGSDFSSMSPAEKRRFVSQRRSRCERDSRGEEQSVLCGANSAISKARKSSQHGVTKMLLVISTIFIILNMPAYIMRLYMYFMDLAGDDEAASAPSMTLYTLQQTFMLLFYSNFAVNFLLYCVTGQNFRRAVVALCTKNSTNPRLPIHKPTNSSTFSRQRTIVSSMSADPSSPRRFRSFSRVSQHTTTALVQLVDYCEGGVGTSSSNNPLKSSSETAVVTHILEEERSGAHQETSLHSQKAEQELLTGKSFDKVREPLEMEG